MQALARCMEGLEKVASEEIAEMTKKKVEIRMPSVLVCEVKDKEAIAACAVSLHSILNLSLLLDAFSFATVEDIVEKVGKVEWGKEIDGSFVVRCDREGEHDFKSNDVERACGIAIEQMTKIPVDLEGPKYTVSVTIVRNQCFVGIDFVGFKLAKRDYRVKVTAASLNPCLAWSMVRIAGWDPKEVLLDPFCRTGEVVIEAASDALDVLPFAHVQEKMLFSRFMPFRVKPKPKEKKLEIFAYDALHVNVRNAEVNAKLAFVRNAMTFSRTDLEWLDTKFQKESVDKVVTAVPLPSRFTQYQDFTKMCKVFFYQCEFMLKKKGKIVIYSSKPETVVEQAKVHKFEKREEWKIRIGTNEGYILLFERKES